MYPGDGQHVGDGGDSSPLRTDQPALRPVQQELGGWELAGAQLVLQLHHLHPVQLPAGRPGLQEEHAELAGVVVGPGQSEGDVAVRGGAEPLVAVQAVDVLRLVDRHSLRGPAHVTPASLLCHPLPAGPELQNPGLKYLQNFPVVFFLPPPTTRSHPG